MNNNKLKPGECPHCHKMVSKRICAHYILYGTAHTVRCNHCNALLSMDKGPLTFQWAQFAGFASTTIPAFYFLFTLRLGLGRGLGYASLCGLLCTAIISILTVHGIYFKIAN